MKTYKAYYIVWNETTYGSGAYFYGVCPDLKSAEKLFNEVCKKEGLDPKKPFRDDGEGNVDSIRIDQLPFIND